MSGSRWAAFWKEFTSRRLPAIRARWAAALPTILVSLTLLFSIWGIFGVRYVVMTSFLTLVFRTRHRQDFRPREMARIAVQMVLVCLAAFMAGRGLWWALALNLVVPFVLVYLLSSKFSPKAYFAYGMEFVFLQLMPITPDQLPVQLGVLAYGLVVVAAALWLHAKIIHRRRHFGTVRKGMDNLCRQLEKLARGESVSAEHDALPPMMIHMNQVIYGSRGYTYLANGYGKVNYLFMLMFQRFYYFTDHFVTPGQLPDAADADWMLRLAELFRRAERELNGPENAALRSWSSCAANRVCGMNGRRRPWARFCGCSARRWRRWSRCTRLARKRTGRCPATRTRCGACATPSGWISSPPGSRCGCPPCCAWVSVLCGSPGWSMPTGIP